MSEPTYEQPDHAGEAETTGKRGGQQAAVCSACTSPALEPGFIEDRGQGSQGYVRWIAGALQRGIFGGASVMGKQRWIVEAWRCETCGHLDLYARQTS